MTIKVVLYPQMHAPLQNAVMDKRRRLRYHYSMRISALRRGAKVNKEVKRDVYKRQVVVQGVHIPAALIVPAAGLVHKAGIVQRADGLHCPGGIVLSPALSLIHI